MESVVRLWCTSCGRVTRRSRQQDSFAQEFESCAAEHLAFEHLDPVDVAFHDTGVPGQCEARGDGVEVAFEVLGEVPEAGQVGSGGGRFDPGRQLVALEVSDRVAEGTHVLGKCRQFGAVGQDGFELEPVAFGQGVGVGEEPARDGAG